MEKKKLPHKIKKPETIDYILLDRPSFVQMVDDFEAVLQKHTKKEYKISILVDGYDGSFDSAKTVVETLDAKDWTSRSSISIFFYPIRDGKNTYDRDLYLTLADANILGYGLKMEFGSELNDIVRLAISQDVHNFIYKYRRNILLKEKATRVVSSLIASGLYLILLGNLIPQDKWISVLLSESFFALIAGLILSIGIVSVATSSVYEKLFPGVEFVEELKTTKFSRMLKISINLTIIIGVISGILGILQFYTGK